MVTLTDLGLETAAFRRSTLRVRNLGQVSVLGSNPITRRKRKDV